MQPAPMAAPDQSQAKLQRGSGPVAQFIAIDDLIAFPPRRPSLKN